MNNTLPDIISINKVRNLEFLRITDEIRPGQYVEWEVEFDYLSYSGCTGFLMACPYNPATLCDEFITEVEI